MRQQLCAVTAITLASQSFCCWRNGKRWVLGERRCCRPLTAHRTQDTVQATHRTNASHQESANPLQPLPALLSHHIASHGKSSRGRRGTYTLSLSQEKRFCWESITWSFPYCLPLSLWGRLGKRVSACSRLPVRRSGQHRLRRHLPPLTATKDNLQERPLLSPCLNKVAFKIFQPTSSWLRRQI